MKELDFTRADRLEALEARMAAKRHGFARTMLHSILRRFRSDFDVNAWLDMYPMTFLETDEWRAIVPDAGGALLDVGAGSGDVTRTLAPLFSRVACTETSSGMAARLERAGFTVHRGDLAVAPAPFAKRSFDAIALLNVLDRCSRPLALLDAALELARPGAAILVAVPLPFRPHVYVGGRSEDPIEWLVPEEADGAEARAAIERALAERSISLTAHATVPYLCPGDSDVPFYRLTSHLFAGVLG